MGNYNDTHFPKNIRDERIVRRRQTSVIRTINGYNYVPGKTPVQNKSSARDRFSTFFRRTHAISPFISFWIGVTPTRVVVFEQFNREYATVGHVVTLILMRFRVFRQIVNSANSTNGSRERNANIQRVRLQTS